MPGKRHHYVPKFLLDRFTDEPTSKAPRLLALSTATGRARRAGTRNEAVIGHYYRLTSPTERTTPTSIGCLTTSSRKPHKRFASCPPRPRRRWASAITSA